MPEKVKTFFFATVLLMRRFVLGKGRSGQNAKIVAITDNNGLSGEKTSKFVGLTGLLSSNDEHADTFLGKEGDIVEAKVSVYKGKSINIDLPSTGSDEAPCDL
tara:strand:- start:112 stop:420 length:309 start_codon:yes stop_codon:yes gene_type:complete